MPPWLLLVVHFDSYNTIRMRWPSPLHTSYMFYSSINAIYSLHHASKCEDNHLTNGLYVCAARTYIYIGWFFLHFYGLCNKQYHKSPFIDECLSAKLYCLHPRCTVVLFLFSSLDLQWAAAFILFFGSLQKKYLFTSFEDAIIAVSFAHTFYIFWRIDCN